MGAEARRRARPRRSTRCPSRRAPGLTSVAADPALPEAFYRAAGYHVCGPRAVRIDMLERLADLIRPLLAWRPSDGGRDAPPKGATGDGGFTVTPEMMSILGCSPDELGGVLKALGFRLDRRPIKADAAVPAQAETPAAASRRSCAGSGARGRRAAALPSRWLPMRRSRQRMQRRSPPRRSPLPTMRQPLTAEVKYEDIWRPRRHPRAERRPERGQRNRQRGNNRATASAAPAPADGAGAVAPSEAAAPAAPTPEPERRSERTDDRRPRGKDRGGERNRERDRNAGQHQRGGPPGDRRPRREERRDDHRRKAEVHTAAPPRRGGIDPDSPFAALGALRDELAKRGKESST